MSLNSDLGLHLRWLLPTDLASLHATHCTRSSSQAAWRPGSHTAGSHFPVLGGQHKVPGALCMRRQQSSSFMSLKAIGEKRRAGQAASVRRKCNIWGLSAAVQWSGIRKTCYLNSKRFFSFTGQQGKVQQAVNLSSLSSSNQSCSLSSPDPSFSFESQTHTGKHKSSTYCHAAHTFLTLQSWPLIFSHFLLSFNAFEMNSNGMGRPLQLCDT